MSWNAQEIRNPSLRAFFVKVFGTGDEQNNAVVSGTTKSAIKFTPKASTATTGVNYHKLVDIGDETGTTAYGFGDVTKPTTGLMASFGRTTVATSTQTDTGADVRVINKLVNTGVNVLKGMYIKAKNYAGATVGELIGLHVDVVADGTVTNGATGIKITTDGTTLNCDMQMSSGAKIFTGTAANETAVYAEVGAKDATGSIYISTSGLYIQVGNAGADADWNKVTSTHT